MVKFMQLNSLQIHAIKSSCRRQAIVISWLDGEAQIQETVEIVDRPGTNVSQFT